VKSEHCDKMSDFISLSTVPVPHKHRTASSVIETFVDRQSELQDKMLRKRKSIHHQSDVFEHCKYQKVECENATSVENVRDECHDEKHTANEKLSNELLLQGTDSGHQDNDRKKKRMKKLCKLSVKSQETTINAECSQLQKRNRKKRSKKARYNEDVLPRSNLSKDISEHSSSSVPVCTSVNVDSSVENVVQDSTMSASKDTEVPSLVSELANASPDELKYIERVCKKHKSKNKQLTVKTETEDTDSKCPVVTASEARNHSPTKESASEQQLNSNDILKLLHAENSLCYLSSRTAVKKAGDKLKCCTV